MDRDDLRFFAVFMLGFGLGIGFAPDGVLFRMGGFVMALGGVVILKRIAKDATQPGGHDGE